MFRIVQRHFLFFIKPSPYQHPHVYRYTYGKCIEMQADYFYNNLGMLKVNSGHGPEYIYIRVHIADM